MFAGQRTLALRRIPLPSFSLSLSRSAKELAPRVSTLTEGGKQFLRFFRFSDKRREREGERASSSAQASFAEKTYCNLVKASFSSSSSSSASSTPKLGKKEGGGEGNVKSALRSSFIFG